MLMRMCAVLPFAIESIADCTVLNWPPPSLATVIVLVIPVGQRLSEPPLGMVVLLLATPPVAAPPPGLPPVSPRVLLLPPPKDAPPAALVALVARGLLAPPAVLPPAPISLTVLLAPPAPPLDRLLVGAPPADFPPAALLVVALPVEVPPPLLASLSVDDDRFVVDPNPSFEAPPLAMGSLVDAALSTLPPCAGAPPNTAPFLLVVPPRLSPVLSPTEPPMAAVPPTAPVVTVSTGCELPG